MPPIVKYAELSNGVVLSYVEPGEESGVPVVLLHGVTDSWRSFELVLPHLPKSIRAFSVTQRGHGEASRPASGYRFTDQDKLMASIPRARLLIYPGAGHALHWEQPGRFASDLSRFVESLGR